jgi:hypothetical protein
MKNFCLSIIAFILFCGWDARADTDFTCLKVCMRDGGSSAYCMGKCSYSATPPAAGTGHYKCFAKCMKGNGTAALCVPRCAQAAAPVTGKAKDYNPDPLDPVRPGDKLSLTPKIVKPPSPKPDMSCMRSCIKEHYQYGLCSRNCIN